MRPLSVGIVRSARDRPGPVPSNRREDPNPQSLEAGITVRNSTDGAASASQKPRMGKGQHQVPSFLSSAGLYPNRSGEHDLKAPHTSAWAQVSLRWITSWFPSPRLDQARSDAQICPGPSSSSSCRQLVSLFHLAPSIQSKATSKQSMGPKITFLATPISNTIIHQHTTLTIGNPLHTKGQIPFINMPISIRAMPTSFIERKSPLVPNVSLRVQRT